MKQTQTQTHERCTIHDIHRHGDRRTARQSRVHVVTNDVGRCNRTARPCQGVIDAAAVQFKRSVYEHRLDVRWNTTETDTGRKSVFAYVCECVYT